MKDSIQRFWAVEHLTGMIIAIVLITIAKGIAKKNLPDGLKHTKTAVMLLVALIIILAVVPWPFREGIGRPWFPGM
jgi:membrane protease YdiL (CAAX protease family)